VEKGDDVQSERINRRGGGPKTFGSEVKKGRSQGMVGTEQERRWTKKKRGVK